jgi:hypothetical protein
MQSEPVNPTKEERAALVTQLKAELLALQNEEREILAFLNLVAEKQARLQQIRGSHWKTGEKATKHREYKNAHYPIYDHRNIWAGDIRRVVYIDKKWVYIKRDIDGQNVQKFSIATGLAYGARAAQKHPDKIDVEKALKIWAEFGPEIPDFYKPQEKK